MSLYHISSAVYEDDEQVAYVQFVDDLLDQPVKLWHLHPNSWAVEALISRVDKTVDVVIQFDDFELNYVYRSKHSSIPDFALTMPLYFEYPFEVGKDLRIVLSIEEFKQLPLPGFRTVTY